MSQAVTGSREIDARIVAAAAQIAHGFFVDARWTDFGQEAGTAKQLGQLARVPAVGLDVIARPQRRQGRGDHDALAVLSDQIALQDVPAGTGFVAATNRSRGLRLDALDQLANLRGLVGDLPVPGLPIVGREHAEGDRVAVDIERPTVVLGSCTAGSLRMRLGCLGSNPRQEWIKPPGRSRGSLWERRYEPGAGHARYASRLSHCSLKSTRGRLPWGDAPRCCPGTSGCDRCAGVKIALFDSVQVFYNQ